MKRTLMFFFFLTTISLTQTMIGGDYYKDLHLTISGSPYILTHNLEVLGASLTFDEGVEIDLSSSSILVTTDTSNDNSQSAKIKATRVKFHSSFGGYPNISILGFNKSGDENRSTGNFDFCHFEGVTLSCKHYSTVSVNRSMFLKPETAERKGIGISTTDNTTLLDVTSTTISGFDTGIDFSSGAKIELQNVKIENCNREFCLSGSFHEDYTLKNFRYPYTVKKDLSLGILNCLLRIEEGVELFVNQIYIRSSYKRSSIIAKNVLFHPNTTHLEISSTGKIKEKQTLHAGVDLEDCTLTGVVFWVNNGSKITLNNCVLEKVNTNPVRSRIIYASGDSSLISVNSCQFKSPNGGIELTKTFTGNMLIRDSDFRWCWSHGLWNKSTVAPDVRYNYWGHASGPENINYNPDGQGVEIVGNALFDPWLTSPPGTTSLVDKVAVNDFSLEQNYPNPFNPVTKISFSIPESGIVILDVYNSLGEKVRNIVREELSSGNHNVELDMSDMASGIYYYKITAGKFSETRKMVLIK